MSVQLRIGFGAEQPTVHISLALAGLVVLAESPDGGDAATVSELGTAGIGCEMDPSGVRFGVEMLGALAKLPDRVVLDCDDVLKPLLELIMHPSDGGVPADLTAGEDSELWLTWVCENQEHKCEVLPSAAAALLCTELAFVATPEAFDVLGKVCQLPLLVGRAHVNLDGFVEIVTSKPQLVESAPLPGLFRIDPSRLGMPLKYAHLIDDLAGFRWSAPPPPTEVDVDVDTDQLPMGLSEHAKADLSEMITDLGAWRAQAVVWPSGLGRRVFVAAALEVLDAWPALVVCRPDDVWPWLRHAELVGRVGGVADTSADVQIVTYEQLATAGGWPRNVQAVVFDSPQQSVGDPHVAAAAARLGSLADAYRIVVTSDWPKTEAAQMSVMELLRPAEFDSTLAVPLRYPPDATARFKEHVGAYISVRNETSPPSDVGWFRRSKVRSLPPVPAQSEAFERALSRVGAAPAITLAQLLELTSAGPEYATSPKVAAAVEAVSDSLDEGRRVVVVTRHSRTAQLVVSMLRGRRVELVTDAATLHVLSPGVRAVVGRFDGAWPDLSRFDHVVIVDWPWSLSAIRDAIGSAAGQAGPALVEVLHSPGSVDDRLVLAAARRDDLGIAPSAPPTPQETAWLLAPVASHTPLL